ncbi:DivIVA domain-containing protein [Amycolatopsis sp. NPDC098790]|uniref:DivIVA domain-containing protein n=1 Tax=Amycolatopsis sp. NPDC098790 TaxID=3363939 RepID=UPI003816117C
MTLPLPESFALTLRGYDRDQVDERIDELLTEIGLLTADRDAAVAEAETLARRLEEARSANAALRARADRLCRTPADPAAVGDRVRHLLELAHAEADGVVAAARQRGAAIVREAEDTAARKLEDARVHAAREIEHARHRVEYLAATERRTADRLRKIDAFLAEAAELLEADTRLHAAA